MTIAITTPPSWLPAIVVGCVTWASMAAPSIGPRHLRAVVLGQAQSELALSSHDMDRTIETVTVVRGPQFADSFQTWSGTVSSTGGWHTYRLGTTATQVIRLGGFEAPDLYAAAEALRPSEVSVEAVHVLAQTLAYLADPVGAEEVMGPEKFSGAAALELPPNIRQLPGWFRDSTVSRSDGSFRVRIAVLSRLERDYPTAWVPHLYAFEFGRDAELRGWSRKSGAAMLGQAATDGS